MSISKVQAVHILTFMAARVKAPLSAGFRLPVIFL